MGGFVQHRFTFMSKSSNTTWDNLGTRFGSNSNAGYLHSWIPCLNIVFQFVTRMEPCNSEWIGVSLPYPWLYSRQNFQHRRMNIFYSSGHGWMSVSHMSGECRYFHLHWQKSSILNWCKNDAEGWRKYQVAVLQPLERKINCACYQSLVRSTDHIFCWELSLVGDLKSQNAHFEHLFLPHFDSVYGHCR